MPENAPITIDEIRRIIEESNVNLIEKLRSDLHTEIHAEIDRRLANVPQRSDLDTVNKRLGAVEDHTGRLQENIDTLHGSINATHESVKNLDAKIDVKNTNHNIAINGLRDLIEKLWDSARDGIKARDDSIAEIRKDQSELEKELRDEVTSIRGDVNTNRVIIDDTNIRAREIATALWGGEQLVGMPMIPLVRNHEKALTKVTSMMEDISRRLQVIDERELARIESRKKQVEDFKNTVRFVWNFASSARGAFFIGGGGLSVAAIIEFLKALIGG